MPHDPVQGRDRRYGAPTLDLETLPREVRSAVEAMVAGREVTLRREGRDVGMLAFRPSVLESTVVHGPDVEATDSVPSEGVPDGVTVVATATNPNAQVIVSEIDDEEFGVSQLGPVSRLLDAAAYLPPRPLREVASSVHAYLIGSGAPQLTAATPAMAPTAALPASPNRPSE